MSEPIVFISHSRVKEGMLEAFRDAPKSGGRRANAGDQLAVARTACSISFTKRVA
jgi:hypothetical protein